MTEMEWIGRKAALIKVGIDDTVSCCANCRHFVQHYVRYDNGAISPLCWGHCRRSHRVYEDGRMMRNGLDECERFEGREEE